MLASPVRSVALSHRIRLAVAYVERSLDSAVNLEEVASHVDLHPQYLSRRFKLELGVTFRDYLLRGRVERALPLLERTPLSIKEISYRVGFSSPEVFCKVFRRFKGSPPSAYRNGFRFCEHQSDNKRTEEII